MSARSARRLLFVVLALALPVPMLGPFDALVPPARYAILLAAASAVAAVEGAAGPVPMILALFAVQTTGALGLAAILAWAVGRLLSPLGPGSRRALVLAACAGLLLAALAIDLYRTPFGRAPRANLLRVLS